MILLDVNVLLDVVQKREPHYRASAAVIDGVVRGHREAVIPAHAVTTIHFLVGRYQDTRTANLAVDWLLRRFTIADVGYQVLARAQRLGWDDFEDAVVAAAAERRGCRTIVTRNIKDFTDSPVPALTPEEFLLTLP